MIQYQAENLNIGYQISAIQRLMSIPTYDEYNSTKINLEHGYRGDLPTCSPTSVVHTGEWLRLSHR